MTVPTGYSLSFSFTAFETSAPSTPKPGANLDQQFVQISASISSIIASMSDVRRADGALENGIVTTDSLSTTVMALMVSKLNPRGLWLTATDYAVGDTVRAPDGLAGTYICGTAHTSGTFATDKAANKWIVLVASDTGGTASGVPSPLLADTGTFLKATGAGTMVWSDLTAVMTSIAAGSAGAPSISFSGDSDTGMYSPQAGNFAFTCNGVETLVFNSSGFTMNGTASLLQVGRDVNKQSYLSTTAASGNILGVPFYWISDNSGFVTDDILTTKLGQLQWTGQQLLATATAYPTAEANIALAGGVATLGLAGGSAGVYYGEDITHFNRWSVGFDQPSNEFRFIPLGAYDMRYTAGTFYIGTQTSGLPSGWVNGVSTYNCYVQNVLSFGQNGDSTYGIAYNGVAILGAITAASLTVNGVLISSAACAPSGSVVEYGPIATASATTIDAAAGHVVTGLRFDGSGNVYIRTKVLALS